MALATLDDHVSSEALFHVLETRNRGNLWKGVAQVFASNLDKAVAPQCLQGLLRILSRRPVPEKAFHSADRCLRRNAAINLAAIADALLDASSDSALPLELFGIFDWIAHAMDRNPLGTLPLLEKLAGC